MDPYYKFTYSDEKSIFIKGDLEEIETHLNKTLVTEMKNYYCGGCNYCCYGSYDSKYWCEKEFKTSEDFSDYYDMCNQRGFSLKATLEKISFLKGDVGYSEESELVWELDRDYKFKLSL